MTQANSPPSTFFPLMAWDGWDRGQRDRRTLARMRDCGLTMVGFVPPRAAVLDACRAAGLRAIVSDPERAVYDWKNVDLKRAEKNVKSLVAEVKKHPAVFGYYLRDEPDAGLFRGLGAVAALFRKYDPGRWPYINLLPNYANEQQLGSASYEEHLARFVRECRPTILSYDNYFFMLDEARQAYYWRNLEQMRNASLRHGIPFWNIVLSVAHFNYREATAADLRLQVYSTLAYGGRGLSYFTYFTPACGNYRQGPVDQFGQETPTWLHLQQVNLQVHRLAPTLLNLASQAVYHLGHIPPGCQGPGPGSLLLEQGGGRMLAGDFKHRSGARYVMLVNTDLRESCYCEPHYRIKPDKVELVSPYTGALVPFDGEQTWLAPGQGALLKLSARAR